MTGSDVDQVFGVAVVALQVSAGGGHAALTFATCETNASAGVNDTKR